MGTPSGGEATRESALVQRVPPVTYFVVSAVFHYLGPAFAVLLFAAVAPLGVAWLRIVSAAVVFACWRRPWRIVADLSRRQRLLLVALGLTLAGMNAMFYLALDRLPLATVGAIEFVGPLALAAAGLRGRRNLAALVLAVAGVALLTDVRLAHDPLGFAYAFANCLLFVAYIVLGSRIAADGATNAVDRLGASMLVAAVAIMPFGLTDATVTFGRPYLLLAGIGVGVCSSVIPYVTDQLALTRLSRATFALLLSLLPAVATCIGVVVLAQVPQPPEIAGIALVVAGIAVHRENQPGTSGSTRHRRRSTDRQCVTLVADVAAAVPRRPRRTRGRQR